MIINLQLMALTTFMGGGLVYLFSLFSYRRRSRGAKPIPGPKGLPLVGNIFDMDGSNLIPVFNKWGAEYGPIVAFEILGVKQIVLGNEKVANDLFVKRGNIYSGRGVPTAMAYLTRDMVTFFMQKTEKWRRQRKILHTVLASTIATTYEPFIELETTYTLQDLLEAPENFNNHLERYAYGVIFRLGLGQSVNSMQSEVVQKSSKSTDETLDAFRPDKFISNLFPFLIKFPRWLVPSNGKLDDMADSMISQMLDFEANVKKGIREGSAPHTWMRHFIENQDEYAISQEEANWLFYSLAGAGTRSPYNALLTFVVSMMEHPEWQEKVQDEVDRVVGSGRLPVFEDLPNLPIVRAVVKEGIRWRSIVAEIGAPHMAEEDDFYEGYFIPKGTLIHANFSMILSERDLYPDGPVYNPDRWLNPAFPTYKEPLTVFPNLANFASFGYGRRACPGTNFTERALTVMVARIAWGFHIRKPIDPETGKEVALNIKYEPTPNPKPFPFPADFRSRSEERARLMKLEAEKRRTTDSLAVQS